MLYKLDNATQHKTSIISFTSRAILSRYVSPLIFQKQTTSVKSLIDLPHLLNQPEEGSIHKKGQRKKQTP